MVEEAAAAVPVVEEAAAAACVFVCDPCRQACASEAALLHHVFSASHFRCCGFLGFADVQQPPDALGNIPQLSAQFYQQMDHCARAMRAGRVLDADMLTIPSVPLTCEAIAPHTATTETLVSPGAVLADLLSSHMRSVTAMAPAIAAAGAAWAERAAARAARVAMVVASSPRTVARWRVGVHSGRLVYYDTVSQASQWAHPLTGSSVWPLVAVADVVAARRMWPPVGSPWELAVAAAGGVCYRHTITDAVQWAPPPGSQVDPAGPTYPPPVGSVVPDASCGRFWCGPQWRGAMPPEHERVSMLASPVAEGEREPRWLGQWDAVAGEHVFVHRITRAVRRGPWVSMPSAEGRIYYLNLRTGWSRWDPPPLWETGWVGRASQTWGAADWRARIPSAVPRGREVCGGAPVGVDVEAALGSCVEQMMLAPTPDGQQAAGHSERLVDLATAISSRFSLPYPAVVAALTAGATSASLLPSAQQAASALLPVLIVAGAGFQVYA